jgi:CRISPR-associated protein Cas2
MRLTLFFDLPVDKKEDRRAYRHFVKDLKSNGFFMLQESVYTKLCVDQRGAEASLNTIKRFLPKEGDVAVLMITEKQFSSIEYLLGDGESDVIDTLERVIEL